MTSTSLLKNYAVEEFTEENSLSYYEQMVFWALRRSPFFDTHAICLRPIHMFCPAFVLACVCWSASECALAWPSTRPWHLWAVSPLATVTLSCPILAPHMDFAYHQRRVRAIAREGPRPTCHSHLLCSSTVHFVSPPSARRERGKNRTGSMARMAVCVVLFILKKIFYGTR